MFRKISPPLFFFLALTCVSFAQSTNPKLTNLPENTVIDLGPFTCTDIGDGQCFRVTDYSGFVYDSINRQMLMFGGGHSTTVTDAVFAFDPNTLTWKEKYQPTMCSAMTLGNRDRLRAAWKSGPAGPYPRPISRHTYDLLAYAPTTNEFILLIGVNGKGYCPEGTNPDYELEGGIAHYSLSRNTWSWSEALGDAAPDHTAAYSSSEYDPISGKIIMLGGAGLYIYDPVSRVKTRAIDGTRTYFVKDESGKIMGSDNMGYANHLVYYPPNQKFYYFERTKQKVYELTLNRTDFSQSTVTQLNTVGTYPRHEEPGYAYDSANKIIGGGVYQNVFYAFNPLTKTWTNKQIQGGSPTELASHAIGYDPINNVFIFINHWQQPNGRRTWAYRYAGGSVTINSDTAAPSIPTGVVATVLSSSQINLSWDPSIDNVGVAGYRILREGSQIDTVAGTSYQNIDLSPSTAYTYSVASYDAAGNVSSESSLVSATTRTRVAPPPTISGSDFQTRCSAAGVIKCVGFDKPADAQVVPYGSKSGLYSVNPPYYQPLLDPNIKASGASSLRWTLPAGSVGGSGGMYFTNFSDDLSIRFGENSEFFVQVRMRFSQAYIKQGSGWKLFAITTGDRVGKIHDTCESLGVTLQRTGRWEFPTMYHSCTGSVSHGPYDAFSEPYNNVQVGDFKFQNGRPAPYCLYTQTLKTGRPFPPPAGNCFVFWADEWMTFQVRIKTGPRTINGEFTNSFIQMWMAREGQPSELVVNWGPYNLSANVPSEDEKYGKIWFLPYTGAEVFTAEASVWYDELIISRSKIADPGRSQSSQAPAAPSGLSLK